MYRSPFVPLQKRLYYGLIITTHTIEKGLSLASPRSLFGQDKIRAVVSQLKKYDGTEGHFPVSMAHGALRDYLVFHSASGVSSPFLDYVKTELESSRQRWPVPETGGVRLVARESLAHEANPAQRRFSCRAYSQVTIPRQTIDRIVSRAQRAPSQCNRQSVRVYCYQDRTLIEQLLVLQGGSAGFAKSVANLFVLASDLSAWGGSGQRNQAYVDGGLFAMCLMLACIEEGLQCCPLNLAKTNLEERRIARTAGIPASQRLIMMIAFGESDVDPLRAAQSPRIPLSDVLIYRR